MKRRHLAFLGLVVLMLTGCDRQKSKQESGPLMPIPAEKLPEITAEMEEGFVDLQFRIQEHKLLSDGSQNLAIAGNHKGRLIGFEVVLGPNWKKGKPDNDIPIVTRRSTVAYRRVGPESDAFVKILNELYGVKLNPQSMAVDTPFTGISLVGDPGNLTSGPVQIKLFFEMGGEDRYAELFTNIDLSARKLEFREKDEGYRRQIVQALTGEK